MMYKYSTVSTLICPTSPCTLLVCPNKPLAETVVQELEGGTAAGEKDSDFYCAYIGCCVRKESAKMRLGGRGRTVTLSLETCE